MSPAPSPYVGLLVATAVALLATAACVARRRSDPGTVPFAALLTASALWAGAEALGLALPPDHVLRLPASQLAGVCPAWLPLLWIAFTLEYTGRAHLLTRWRVVLLGAVPAVVSVGVFGYPTVDLVWTSFEASATGPVTVAGVRTASITTASVGRGPLYFGFLAYAYALLLSGVVVLFEFVLRYDRLYTEPAAQVVTGVAVPSLGSVLTETGFVPVTGLDAAPFMLSASAVAFANAAFRHRLFETVPATRRIGRASVVEGMRDAVVVTDTDDRVVDLNPRAASLFDCSRSAAIGRSVDDCVPVALDPDAESFEATVGDTIHEVTVSPIADGDGRQVGQAFVFRDVTDHRHDRQRVTVLNRLLRHNLRTEINLIDGYARQLRRADDPDPAMVDRIVDSADELGTLARKAREIERVMDETDGGGRTDVAALVDDARASLERTRPSLSVAPSSVDGAAVSGDRATLTAVLVDLFDAMARHSDAAAPTVTVRTEPAGDAVALILEDDDGGIPESEYAVVEAGEETQLDHASGLSLWLVKWGVARTDATVAFDAPREGAVTLELPRAVDREDGAAAATEGRADD